MSPTSKEDLRKFEQRMHDKGSDGFADGPRPWEHWDESGNQASSRVWEGSARRVYGSRNGHSLGHRLLSFLAFLALATLLVGIGGVYYTHTQTQQVAQQGIQLQPLPINDVTRSVSTAAEPVAEARIIRDVDELNVLKAPAAGSVSASSAAVAASDERADVDSDVASAPPPAGTAVPPVASVATTTEQSELLAASQPTPPPADSNIDSVSIETVVTEKSVTTTVYTRHPQQDEAEVIAAIETTPPPFAHEVTPAAVTAATATDSTDAEAATMTSSEDVAAVDTPGMDTESEATPDSVVSQDMLTLTSPGEETLAEGTATSAAATATEDSTIMAPAEAQADAGIVTVDTAASAPQDTAEQASLEADTTADEFRAAAAAVANQDTAEILLPTDKKADVTSEATESAPEETIAKQPATEETTQIASAEPASAVESTTPAETAQADTAVQQPIMPVAKQGGWVINLASYTWKSTANKKLALFQDQGVDAEVFEVMIKDKPMYRVRVTGFTSSRAARAEVAAIEAALDLEGAWVSRR